VRVLAQRKRCGNGTGTSHAKVGESFNDESSCPPWETKRRREKGGGTHRGPPRLPSDSGEEGEKSKKRSYSGPDPPTYELECR